jgi:hypothetical protein
MRTEDDIRAAFRALAKQAPDDNDVLTAMREQLDKAIAGPPQGARRSMGRWMAPLAAAAAVIAVTASAVAIADGPSPHQPASGALLKRLPRYYMTLLYTGAVGQRIVVKDTRTGATIVTARPPAPFHTFAAIAGAADDRTFVLAARPVAGSVMRNSQNIEKLFRARLNPAKGTLTITPLPIPEFTPATLLYGMALSPDGNELAVELATGRYHYQLQIRIYSLAGKLLNSWESNGAPAILQPNPGNMSWAGTGVLAINWMHITRNARNTGTVWQSGVWLLNTHAAGGNLAGQSRLIVPGNALPGFYVVGDGVLSSNGETISAICYDPGQTVDRWKVEEFSAATGRPIRALWRVRLRVPKQVPERVGVPERRVPVPERVRIPYWLPGQAMMWSNASGSVLVLQANLISGPIANSHTAMGVLRGSHFRPIPGTLNTKLYYYDGLVF